MNALPFVIGAYAITIAGTVGIVVASFAAMRRAERDAESLRK